MHFARLSFAPMRNRFLLLFLFCATAALAAKQPPTHEALWLMKRVGAPAVSPDGRWVVVSVTNPSYDEKEQTSDLWLVPADGSAQPRQITFTKPAESDVAWSPDSRRIAFSTKREGDESAQVYVLDIADGGEAHRVTNEKSAARAPQWSPDGKAILFATGVWPDEHKPKKYNVRVYDSFPIRQWDRWLDAQQTHLEVQPLDGGKARDLFAGTKLIASPGFAGHAGEGSRDEIEAAWSPDGQSVVFAVTTTRNTAAYAEVAYDLYRASAGGGEPQRIAHEDGTYAHPHFSPDGKTLFATFEPNNGKIYNLTRLVAFDWPSMANRRVLTASSDRSVGAWAVAPDSRTIYFTAEDAGLEKIYSVPAAGGDVTLAVDSDRGVYTDLAIPEKASTTILLGRWGSSVDPAEVVRVDRGARRNLTNFTTEAAANIDWAPPRHFWFTSTRGRKIHNMLVVPAGFDETKKYPLFVVMHGGPASMWRDQISLRWNYHLLASPGYVVLLTNYSGSTGFGEAFGQAIQLDPLKGPGDEINEAADEAIKRFPFIDGTRQAAGGASYGGHLANWMEASTTRYKCLISHAGLVNMESQWGTSDTIYHRELMMGGPFWENGALWREQNPIRFAARFKTPMLLSVGEHDFRVPMNETLENWAVLQRMRVPSRLLVWPDENHWVLNPENSREWYRQVFDWLAKWL
jgi:dipeptidyl aminopeptidase/acylaminoacyl peptidase